MKIVNDNLVAGQSLVDKIWNDAMETAALHCEAKAYDLFAANGESDGWVWPAGRICKKLAADFRGEKRVPT